MQPFTLTIDATDGAARAGRLDTAHGAVDTPAFMPVGTAGTVKAMTVEAVEATGAQMILGNSYHLMLRPGAERIASLGGLRDFMKWTGPVLTDSGGFQIMSLAKFRTLSEEGVIFQSHLDGSRHNLTPERAMEIQNLLGSTVSMVLDECTPFPATEKEAEDSMQLSMRWAERCRGAFEQRPGYATFGIVQGGVYPHLREASANALTAMDFEGYAIGGLAVGEGQDMMFETAAATIPHLPADKPRYLMGVGKPLDIIGAVQRGVDMFDCVLPTRSGRTAQAFTHYGTVNLRNARHADDPRPLDESVSSSVSQTYSRAYLHHLIKAEEILGMMLLTWHNLAFYQQLMARLRAAIRSGTLDTFAHTFSTDWSRGDIEPL
ncbi:MAG: tRNA guanosine(34) transglycosylase Tgt [Rhodospirillaceae bacterium]|nr:tRNA guanosine(34) transglycosylase Tgt [Rhodospirillaceae bacterium]